MGLGHSTPSSSECNFGRRRASCPSHGGLNWFEKSSCFFSKRTFPARARRSHQLLETLRPYMVKRRGARGQRERAVRYHSRTFLNKLSAAAATWMCARLLMLLAEKELPFLRRIVRTAPRSVLFMEELNTGWPDCGGGQCHIDKNDKDKHSLHLHVGLRL